jgi:hypothetical protein
MNGYSIFDSCQKFFKFDHTRAGQFDGAVMDLPVGILPEPIDKATGFIVGIAAVKINLVERSLYDSLSNRPNARRLDIFGGIEVSSPYPAKQYALRFRHPVTCINIFMFL